MALTLTAATTTILSPGLVAGAFDLREKPRRPKIAALGVAGPAV